MAETVGNGIRHSRPRRRTMGAEMSTSGVDLCYVIPHGFVARTVLHSRVIPCLQQHGLSVALIVPTGAGPSVGSVAGRYGIYVEESPRISQRRLFLNQVLHRYLSEDIRRNP